MAQNNPERHERPPEHPEVHHELTDINIRAVALFGLGLIGAAIVIHVGVLLMFELFAARRVAADPPALPVGILEGQLPPEPRLQLRPPQDLERIRRAEDAVLREYGWIDEPAGVVRLPIDRAMEVLLERGLPARPEPEALPRRGMDQGFAGPSSGRMVGRPVPPEDDAPDRAPRPEPPEEER